MAKKDAYRRMLVAVRLVVSALAYGCAGRDPVDEAVDPGGPLVSEEGRIAFTHAAKLNWSDVPSSESDLQAIDVDGSGERRLTDSPGPPNSVEGVPLMAVPVVVGNTRHVGEEGHLAKIDQL